MQAKGTRTQAGPYQLFCRQWGTAGPVVVMIHGIPTNSYLWHTVAPTLGETCRVIAIDLLGYGQSDSGPVEDLTLPRQGEHILALLDTLGIGQVHVVGHDLGGGIGQILALQHSDRVLSMVVTDGVCFSNWPLPQVVGMRRPAAPAFEASPLIVQEMLRMGVFKPESLTAELMAAFTQPVEMPGGAERLRNAALALEHHQTEALVPHLPSLQLPVTILWGQHDRLLPAYWGWRLRDEIPGSHFTLIPNAGHFIMLDQPMLVAQELANHLQRAGR